MKTKDLTNEILEYLNNSPYSYFDYDSNEAEKVESIIQEAFALYDVSKAKRLLIAFAEWIDNEGIYDGDNEDMAEAFLKSN